MICTQCGAAVEEGLSTCPRCFTPITKPGLFRRLLNALFASRLITVKTVIRAETKEQITVPDPATGQPRVFHSLDEVPPEIRAKFQESLTTSQANFSFTYRSPDGKEQTFHSLEEMPANVRTMYEQVILPEMRRISPKQGQETT
jgi:hypothetical protein